MGYLGNKSYAYIQFAKPLRLGPSGVDTVVDELSSRFAIISCGHRARCGAEPHQQQPARLARVRMYDTALQVVALLRGTATTLRKYHCTSVRSIFQSEFEFIFLVFVCLITPTSTKAAMNRTSSPVHTHIHNQHMRSRRAY